MYENDTDEGGEGGAEFDRQGETERESGDEGDGLRNVVARVVAVIVVSRSSLTVNAAEGGGVGTEDTDVTEDTDTGVEVG